jgi:putative membrane protein
MALCGILMYTLPIMLVVMLVLRRVNRYSREELEEHLRDYPWSVANEVGRIDRKLSKKTRFTTN